MRLRPLASVQDTLGVSDPRAMRRRLEALGCPARKIGNRWLVDLDEVEAIRLPRQAQAGSGRVPGRFLPADEQP